MGIKVGPVARQFLIAVQDGHHCEEQRIASQHGDGLGFADGLLQALALGRRLRRVVKGLLVPALKKISDLSRIQILQHEVLEVGISQPLRLVAHDTRGDEDGQQREVTTEPLDVVHDLRARLNVEVFVQSIQQQHEAARLCEQAGQQARRP